MDDTQGLLSVIVPVYNAETTLRQCVDSILVQEYKDFELLLIDDGSQDGSPAICDEYAKQDVRVTVYHKENGGVSSARNVGLDKAKGEWITFIDADDYITNGYFEEVTQHQEDVLFKGYYDDKDDSLINRISYQQLNRSLSLKDFLASYLSNCIIRCPWGKFFKRSLIGKLRFLSDMSIGEDAYFSFCYLAKCNDFAVLPNGEYVFRVAKHPYEVKYAISVDYATQSLQFLQVAFDKLVKAHSVDKSLFLQYIGYFKRISKSHWRKDKLLWYNNREIRALYDYVWPGLSVLQKIRLTVLRLCKR